jgi:hypothetical protein
MWKKQRVPVADLDDARITDARQFTALLALVSGMIGLLIKKGLVKDTEVLDMLDQLETTAVKDLGEHKEVVFHAMKLIAASIVLPSLVKG